MISFDTDQIEDETDLFFAGCIVPAGTYQMIGTLREVQLDCEGMLPATCDGRVAVYQRRAKTWAERKDSVDSE